MMLKLFRNEIKQWKNFLRVNLFIHLSITYSIMIGKLFFLYVCNHNAMNTI